MSYIYENSIDLIEEQTQLSFIQESINIIGLNEEFSPKEALKNVWEKIKSGFNWIRRKINELISCVKDKFNKKDKEAETIVKEVQAKAKDSKKVEQATTALAVIAKKSVPANTDNSDNTTKATGLRISNNSFEYEKINDGTGNEIMNIISADTKDVNQISAELNSLSSINKFMVNSANSSNPEGEINSKKEELKNKQTKLEGLYQKLTTKVSVNKVDAAVTKDIYDSYTKCTESLNKWVNDSAKFEKSVNDITNKVDKTMKTITTHSTSDDSNDNERAIMKNAHSMLSVLNQSVQIAYKNANRYFNILANIKNSNYAALAVIYRAYQKTVTSEPKRIANNGIASGVGQNGFVMR